MTDLSDLFRSLRWRRYRIEATAPHSLHVTLSDGGKVAVLVLRRGRPEGDWALSAGALEYMKKALREQRIAQGFIALVDKWTVIGLATVNEIATRLDGLAPNEGPYGPYFWLTLH